MAEPLLILTRGKKHLYSNFNWGDDQQASFEALKEHLVVSPVLKFPNFEKEFCIETDFSLFTLGAVLSQSQDDSSFENRFPVAFARRLLSKAEKNYGVTNFEGLTVSWAISHFETYIHGMHFIVITDHSALKALKGKSILTGRLLRRADKLLEYDFDVIYCSGRDNVVPDFLSRIYLVELTS